MKFFFLLTFFLFIIYVNFIKCDLKQVPGISYVGQGYDIYSGNPSSSGNPADPGFRGNVFAMDYGKGSTTNGDYKIPKGVSVLSGGGGSCSIEQAAYQTSYSLAYYNRLKKQTTIDTSVVSHHVNASFSRSKDYQSVKAGWASKSYMTYLSQAYCETYTAFVDGGTKPPLTADFTTSVNKLPSSYDFGAYYSFIQGYGTHYAQRLVFGASFGQLASLTVQNFLGLQAQGYDVNNAASLGSKVSFGITSMSSNDTAVGKKFNSMCASKKEITFGSRPPADGSPITWAQTAGNNPVPLNYNLTDISTILTKEYFPGDKHISDKQKNLQTAIKTYCNSTNGCNAPVNPMSCQNPGDGTNCQKFGSQYEWTDEVSYSCNAGWKATSGSTRLFCGSTNQWIDDNNHVGTQLECSDGPYLRVVSLISGDDHGKCLTYDNKNTKFDDCKDGNKAQQWKQHPVGSGTFMLCNPNTGSALRMKRAGVIESCDAAWSCNWNNDKHMLWSWTSHNSGWYLTNQYWNTEQLNYCHSDGTCGRNKKDCDKDKNSDCLLSRDYTTNP